MLSPIRCLHPTRRLRSSWREAARRRKESRTIAIMPFAWATPSPSAMLEKAKWVLGEMERRMSAFGGDWSQTTGVQLYTVHDIFPFLEAELVKRGALRHGLTWHFNRPPVVDLEYEMDCRCVHTEKVVQA